VSFIFIKNKNKLYFLRVYLYKNFFIFNNMDNIIEPNDSFDFSKLSLANPVGIQGGAYFTKLEHNRKSLYIQTTKGQTKQGFVKTGKKYYCDLMFDNSSETLIYWFEKLEEKCRKLIYDKKDTWFQSNLEENDIETAFNSTVRIYKSGKYYLIRTNVKNNQNNTPNIKIYNEDETIVNIDDINSETNIVTILEIQGIKFTSRNFQIEIDLKQIMVLNNEPIFNNCLIKTNKIIKTTPQTDYSLENKISIDLIQNTDKNQDDLEELISKNDLLVDSNIIEQTDKEIIEQRDEDIIQETNEDIIQETNEDIIQETNEDIIKQTNEEIIKQTNEEIIKQTNEEIIKQTENQLENINIELEDIEDIEDLDTNIESEKVNKSDLPLDNLETITLKKPNQVYFDLYKEARKKAKIAKKQAILAYLEVKNIKKSYLIDNLDDSDSEFDAEIDEVSESELDQFD